MEREQLERVAAAVPEVGVILDMTAMEPITDGDRARLAFRTLLGLRHLVYKQLQARGHVVRLTQVAWPDRLPEAQGRVLLALGREVDRLEAVLSVAVPVAVPVEQVAA
jgi:hypothetical protein